MKPFHVHDPAVSSLWTLATLLLAVGRIAVVRGYEISFDILANKRVLVVGGSGRVGGSVVQQLLRHRSEVTAAGTKKSSFDAACERWRRIQASEMDDSLARRVNFEPIDRESAESVARVLRKHHFDLVIHTAGPFQGRAQTPNCILQACVERSVPYMDVCDDYCTSMAAKAKYASKATSPCILSTGCWPGISSLMAKQLVRQTLDSFPNVTAADLSVDFSFFTAGSGGAGVTLLVATFLILAEKALVVQNGRRRSVDVDTDSNATKAMKNYTRVSFGSVVGDCDVAPLNLLETASVHDVLGVGSTSARFGTAPNFWNALLGFMAQLPPSLLMNEDLMRLLSVFSMPIVRLVDIFAGATNSMRCDVTCDKIPSLRATAIYGHENLEPCVGECVVAFACAVLSGAVPKGLWFPEEAVQGGNDAATVLNLASVGTHTTDVEAEGLVLAHEMVWGAKTTKTSKVEV